MVEGLALEVVIDHVEVDDGLTEETLLEAEDIDNDTEAEDTPLES